MTDQKRLEAIPATGRSLNGAGPAQACSGMQPAGLLEITGDIVTRSVTMVTGISRAVLLGRDRGNFDASLARQLAMYLMHTAFSCNYREVGEFFRRDRTTVAHACKNIENLRDQPAFETRIECVEALLYSVRRLGESSEGAEA